MAKKLIIIVGFVVLAGLIYVVFTNNKTNPAGAPVEDSVAMTSEEQAAAAAETVAQQAAVSSVKEAVRYSHKAPDFSFDKPEGYTVGALPGEDGGQTLVVQKSVGSGTSYSGFQIVITPLDEPMTLTPDLIKSDLPGTSVSGAQKISLDGKGNGMMFSSNNESFGGKSFEIWFATPTHLYQITSYAGFAPELQKIIGTWKFN